MTESITDRILADLRYKIEVMEAYKNGSPIEVRLRVTTWSDEWTAASNPAWCWHSYEYRVKRTPRELWGLETTLNGTGSVLMYRDNQLGAVGRYNPGAKLVKFREVLED